MSEQELKALPPVTLDAVFKFIHEHFAYDRPRKVTTRSYEDLVIKEKVENTKPHALQDIEMTVTRDKQEIPVQVVIKSDGNHEAYVCEDKGGFKESQSIYLYPEELNEAEARYYGEDE